MLRALKHRHAMDCRNPIRFWVMSLILALAIFSPSADAASKISTAHFDINYANVSDALAQRFAEDIEQAYRDVGKFLGKDISQRISVSISDDHLFPHYKRNKKLIAIPGNRLRGDAPGPPHLKGRGPGIPSLISNVLMSSKNKSWGTFLETGLETYMNELFHKKYDRAFPTMGKEIHQATATAYRRFSQLFPLKDVEEARTRRQRHNSTRQLAYLQEASFVKFLIETHGKEKFFEVFDGKSFDAVYDRNIGILEREWIKLINGIRITN
jgi:hypothetical protein